MRDRWLVAVCYVGTACFAVSYGIAIALYPGGTWFNRYAQGHSFWMNFLCDLMQTRALNGGDASVGSLLARMGTFAMLVALVSFYTQIARLESPVSLFGRIAHGAGWVACAFGCVVPLVPSNLFRNAHVISVICAFVPSLVATIAALIVCLRTPGISRWIRAMAILTLGAGGIDGLLYAYAYAQVYGFVPFGRSPWINLSLPIFQRVATIGLLAWVIAVCVHTSTSKSRESGLNCGQSQKIR